MNLGGSSETSRPEKLSFTPEGGSPFHVQYNPTELKVSKGVNWEENKELGGEDPTFTFTTPKPLTMSIELNFDTTYEGASGVDLMNPLDRAKQGLANVAAAASSAVGLSETAAVEEAEYKDVRKMWVNHLVAMTLSKSESGEWSQPPIVTVKWSDFELEAVITKLDTTYTMFGSDGTPIRAKVSLELKEYKIATEVETVEGTPMSSQNVQLLNPDHGENIYSLAMKFGLDWRMIALANNIDDPTDIPGNLDLIIPMVTGAKV